MKYMLSVTVAVLLTGFSVHSANAQPNVTMLTNAHVIRFVAMGISEQSVTTLINDANVARATKFDLGPAAVADLAAHGVSPAVITEMHESPKAAPAASPAVNVQKPSVVPQEPIPPMLAALATVDRTKFARTQAAGMALRMSRPTVAPNRIEAMLKTFKSEIDAVRVKATTEGDKELMRRYERTYTWFTVGFYGMHIPGKELESYPSLQDARAQIDFIQQKVFSKKTK
jgi:hypothetical protein